MKQAARPFNARRRQMAATHVKVQRTYRRKHTASISRIRKKVHLALFLPAYYSAAVARRYLKSDMSNTDVARRRRRMSRASLTTGFYCYSGRRDATRCDGSLACARRSRCICNSSRSLDVCLLSALFRFDPRSTGAFPVRNRFKG